MWRVRSRGGTPRYTDDGEGLNVPLNVAIQSKHKSKGVRFAGLHSFVQFVPVLWPNHNVLDAHCGERAVQAVAERTGFIATVDRFSQRQLLFRPRQKLFGCELLCRLRSCVVQLPDYPIAVGVNIDAKVMRLALIAVSGVFFLWVLVFVFTTWV